MLASDVLGCLPPWLDSIVLFRVPPLRAFLTEDTLRQMFGLSVDVPIDDLSHIVVMPGGPVVAFADRPEVMVVPARTTGPAVRLSPSALDRYRDVLGPFGIDEADCLGLGALAPRQPVVLHVTI